MRRLILATLAALGLVLVAAAPANANTYGWKWAEVVDVYDGTGGVGNWQVAEAAAEWGAKSGLVTRMTSDPATANILVYEGTASADCGTWSSIGGCTYLPSTSGGVAYGTSTIYLMSMHRDNAAAEHIAVHEIGHALGLDHTDSRRSVMRTKVTSTDYYTAPQSTDYRDMKALYGR